MYGAGLFQLETKQTDKSILGRWIRETGTEIKRFLPKLWIWGFVRPPSKSLLPIQVSPNWFWPKGESDLDARYRYISTGKYRHHTTPKHRQIQMCTNIQAQVWGLETCRGEPGTDILTGWLEVRRRPDGPWHWEVCHSLSGKGDRICVFLEIGFVSMKNPICHNTYSRISSRRSMDFRMQRGEISLLAILNTTLLITHIAAKHTFLSPHSTGIEVPLMQGTFFNVQASGSLKEHDQTNLLIV